jgi:hypothetical protein
MRRIILMLVFSFPFIIFGLTGCETFDTGPGPDVIQGPKRPAKARKDAETVYEKKRVSAPDEDAPIGPTPKSASQTVQDENIEGKTPATNPDGSIRSTYKMTFTGSVTGLNAINRTIAVKTSDKYLSFDLIDPVLRGYNTVSDIKIGDIITLGYIPAGIAIAKGEAFPEDLRRQTAADQILPSRPKAKNSRKDGATRTGNRSAPVRVKYKVNRLSFAEIDNNKDGKISPVELGCVLPSVTMDIFKKYDRNGDGCLDENEYKAVKKK